VELHEPNPAPDRYHRQTLLPQIGVRGQARLRASRVLLVGCGALGSVVAEQLARAGVGAIRIADRDVVELTNLQRQMLFDESDAREGLPKAVAAARRLCQINSDVTIEPLVTDVDGENVEQLVDAVQLIVDGTDNVETRYVINDAAVKHAMPWVYGACVGTEGRVLALRTATGACLRCIFPNPPAAGELATCDTAGVLGPAATVVAAIQAAAAIKMLSGNPDALEDQMLSFDLWSNRFKSISTAGARRPDCPTCGLRRFEFLERASRDLTTRLCGRNAVQVRPAPAANGFSLDRLAEKLAPAARVKRTEHLVRATVDGGIELTAFADGRVIVHGTCDVARARSIYARFIGA
jgi:adenylyltransferase/sulfurtransferase